MTYTPFETTTALTAGQVNKRLAELDSGIAATVGLPVGCILPYGYAVPPTGWLLCDGAAVSRSTYAALFAAIGTTFGAGDGSTTFNVPDCRGRTPIGVGQGAGLTNRAMGAKVGVERHEVDILQIPAHTHTEPLIATGLNTGTGVGFLDFTIGSTLSTVTGGATGLGTTGPHNNMQPTLIANYLIKV